MNYHGGKCYTYISTKVDTTNIFPFISIFAQIFTIPHKISNFGPFQLDIIVYIVSKVMNYDYAKFHAFITKLTMDVIFRWL